MFFRFGAALFLVLTISLFGIALEKRVLSLKREISLQHYRLERLMEREARLRVRAAELGAPERIARAIADGAVDLQPPEQPLTREPRRAPLLQWQLRSSSAEPR
ncbi:MAG: hypothetical protein ACF8PG_03195 [Maioricimonas sp. JB045]|uniref:hypothetical protein n=1 Tax=Maioricimonas sp. JC845 TaxID=3232138 RepID=UPI003458F8F2